MFSASYVYWLPNADGSKADMKTDVNSVIIIGPNGSGKSKLGAWMEGVEPDRVHRIAAQRDLNFSEHISYMSYEEAQVNLFYGKQRIYTNKPKYDRWGFSPSSDEIWRHPTTTLLKDFDDALSALFSKANHENASQRKLAREARSTSYITDNAVEKTVSLWEGVFKQRRLTFNEDTFSAAVPNTNISYSATEMSDGERAVLYLIAQVLCIPDNCIIVMDEPEIHLHPSLMNILWRELEDERDDCLFIYITHDLEFISSHSQSDVVWIRGYDGNSWDYEKIDPYNLPSDLPLQILGNTRPILFCEGQAASIDKRVFDILYPNHFVVPCGSCGQVIQSTKAYQKLSIINHMNAIGIIDRDYRDEKVLADLEISHIYSLRMAEIENIFLLEPVLSLAAERFLVEDVDTAVSKAKDHVIERFRTEFEKQVQQATVSALKHQLSSINLEPDCHSCNEELFKERIGQISWSFEYSRQRERYTNALVDEDYVGILCLFKDKTIVRSVGKYLGCKNDYVEKMIRLLGSKDGASLREIFREYLPSIAD